MLKLYYNIFLMICQILCAIINFFHAVTEPNYKIFLFSTVSFPKARLNIHLVRNRKSTLIFPFFCLRLKINYFLHLYHDIFCNQDFYNFKSSDIYKFSKNFNFLFIKVINNKFYLEYFILSVIKPIFRKHFIR